MTWKRTIDKRVPIIVTDTDGRETHFHFIALAPRGMMSFTASKLITEEFAKIAYDLEWNYSWLATSLKRRGFDIIEIARWDENYDGWSGLKQRELEALGS